MLLTTETDCLIALGLEVQGQAWARLASSEASLLGLAVHLPLLASSRLCDGPHALMYFSFITKIPATPSEDPTQGPPLNASSKTSSSNMAITWGLRG